MIADRTAYDVRYTGKLSNRFRLGQAYERLVRTIRSYLTFGVGAEHSSAEATVWAQCAKARSDSTGRIYERTETPSTQAWPLSVTDQSSVVHDTKSLNNRT